MAFVTFHDGKPQTLTHNQAVMLDKVKRGLITGSPRQKAYAKRVKKIYFARQYREAEARPPVPDWWQK